MSMTLVGTRRDGSIDTIDEDSTTCNGWLAGIQAICLGQMAPRLSQGKIIYLCNQCSNSLEIVGTVDRPNLKVVDEN